MTTFREPNSKLVQHPLSVFPVDEWDVPMLNIEMQPFKVDLPWDAWNSVKRNYQYATIHFYEWDYKFNYLFEQPEKIIPKNPKAVVEPNCSTDVNTPLAYLLGMVYAKRWLARTWQSYGIPVWVDVNFAASQAKWQMLGVPQGWKAYATRGCPDYFDYNQDQFEAACSRAGTKNILFVVVGGGERFRRKVEKKGWIWVPDTWQRITGRLDQF